MNSVSVQRVKDYNHGSESHDGLEHCLDEKALLFASTSHQPQILIILQYIK